MTDPNRTPKPNASDCVSACSLDERALKERLAMIRREFVPHVSVSEPRDDGFVWELAYDETMQGKLEHWIELERECCSGITFVLSRPSESTLRLEVSGFSAQDLENLKARAAAAAPASGSGRFLRSAGLGFVGAFTLFCILPLGIAALAGAAIAGPLLLLDDPIAIAAGSLVFGCLAWAWMRRREARAPRAV